MKNILAAIAFFFCSLSSTHAETQYTGQPLKLATTTSTDNSGLLNALFPVFKTDTGIDVQVIAVGTGKALKMGRDGDVDVVLVHARQAEETFVAERYGEQRHDVMYNDFVIVGPDSDPAKVSDADSPSEALKRIASTASLFISRGDDSGTHKKEKQLWNAAHVEPSGRWYREAGQGMGKVLQMAGELDAYTMTDRGTWLAYEEQSPLGIVLAGDQSLFNPYGIIAVSPKRYPDINHKAAQALIDWLVSERGQTLIRDFKINGKPLFIPNAAVLKETTDSKPEDTQTKH